MQPFFFRNNLYASCIMQLLGIGGGCILTAPSFFDAFFIIR